MLKKMLKQVQHVPPGRDPGVPQGWNLIPWVVSVSIGTILWIYPCFLRETDYAIQFKIYESTLKILRNRTAFYLYPEVLWN